MKIDGSYFGSILGVNEKLLKRSVLKDMACENKAVEIISFLSKNAREFLSFHQHL